MIIGKDKERVRRLEIETKLSRELLSDIVQDLNIIGNTIKNDVSFEKEISGPYWKIWNDIGRCEGLLNEFKK